MDRRSVRVESLSLLWPGVALTLSAPEGCSLMSSCRQDLPTAQPGHPRCSHPAAGPAALLSVGLVAAILLPPLANHPTLSTLLAMARLHTCVFVLGTTCNTF